jgi:hypothetical protein
MVYNYTKPRGPIAAMYSSPGPCYGLPTLVGQQHHDPRSVHGKGPAYPFGIRHGQSANNCSPGPCHQLDPKYTRTGKAGTPSYSLYSRCHELKGFQTPGPAGYDGEKPMQRNAPKYSFGTRHNLRSSDNTPGPNNYMVPTVIGAKTVQSGKRQAPSYSLSGRSKIGSFHEDLQKTPGPGAHGESKIYAYKRQPPVYSMTSRNAMPGDSTNKPGPGAHACEKVWMHKREAPHFSFGIRHSQYAGSFIINGAD